jgi:Na+/glutamate symporter
MLILSDDDSKVQQKWFFVVFQLIVNYFIMSILVGFVIDNIMVSFDLNKTEEEKRKIIGKFFPSLNARN